MSEPALLTSIKLKIVDPIIYFLFALALLYFLYGVLEIVRNSGSEEARRTGEKHVIWGVIGMFIMISFYGIMRVVCTTIGASCG